MIKLIIIAIYQISYFLAVLKQFPSWGMTEILAVWLTVCAYCYVIWIIDIKKIWEMN